MGPVPDAERVRSHKVLDGARANTQAGLAVTTFAPAYGITASPERWR